MDEYDVFLDLHTRITKIMDKRATCKPAHLTPDLWETYKEKTEAMYEIYSKLNNFLNKFYGKPNN